MQGPHAEVGPRRQQEPGAARAVGADQGTGRQRVERGSAVPSDQRVARVGPLRVGGDYQPWVLLQRQVLGAVHNQIDLARQQGGRQLADEHPLTRRGIDGTDVSSRDDRDELHLVAGSAQAVGNQLALDEGEPGPAGPEPEHQTVLCKWEMRWSSRPFGRASTTSPTTSRTGASSPSARVAAAMRPSFARTTRCSGVVAAATAAAGRSGPTEVASAAVSASRLASGISTTSVSTASARQSSSWAATVRSPGSPGPAPTRATRPGRSEPLCDAIRSATRSASSAAPAR